MRSFGNCIAICFLLGAFLFMRVQKSVAQPADSLLNIWKNTSVSDSVRANAYEQYIWENEAYSRPFEALKMARDLRDFSEKTGYTTGVLKSANLMGVIYNNSGNYGKALLLFEQNLALSEQTGNIKGVLSALGNIGLIYQYQNQSEKALNQFLRVLKIAEESGDKRAIATTRNNIGVARMKLEKPNEAMSDFRNSFRLCEEIRDTVGMARALNNIAWVYEKTGFIDSSIRINREGLQLETIVGNKKGMALSQYSIGSKYLESGKAGEAIEWCGEAFKISEASGYMVTLRDACDCLYKANKEMNNMVAGLRYLEMKNRLDDSLKKEEAGEKLLQMEFRQREAEDSIAAEKEKLMVQLKHEEELHRTSIMRNQLIGSVILLVIISVGFYLRSRLMRKSRNAIAVEKERSENLLLNILPQEIAEELKREGKAQAREFRDVSILFTDFKGFTSVSEKMNAVELVDEIHHCFKAFDGICDQHGIEKIKTIGDSYMAAGGLPVASDDSAKKTVMVALEMQEFMEKRRAERMASGAIPFEMRAGIHTGSVVAGIVGVRKFQYDVWGDTVNTASRMESSGLAGRVNISRQTYERIKNDKEFEFEHRGLVEAKGKGEVEMWFVKIKKG
ncbi:MAG: tetratricopeptide repeat protein [Bacteroidetes bacterium]|nr:tetratricopeptide repeat protein [Bacteroidota bacterium]